MAMIGKVCVEQRDSNTHTARQVLARLVEPSAPSQQVDNLHSYTLYAIIDQSGPIPSGNYAETPEQMKAKSIHTHINEYTLGRNSDFKLQTILVICPSYIPE